MTWYTKQLRGSASRLHEFVPPEQPERTLHVLEVQAPAIVLGSSQPDQHIDFQVAATHGVSVVRRRSGGGAVLLVPNEHVWIDIWLPVGDMLWRDDVGVAADWLGQMFAQALATAQLPDLWVHRGTASNDPLSRKVCFLGRGPGEVFCGEQKVVGVSQRRTREWIRFQTITHRHFNTIDTTALLGLGGDRRVVKQLQSQVYEIADLPILELLQAHLPEGA